VCRLGRERRRADFSSRAAFRFVSARNLLFANSRVAHSAGETIFLFKNFKNSRIRHQETYMNASLTYPETITKLEPKKFAPVVAPQKSKRRERLFSDRTYLIGSKNAFRIGPQIRERRRPDQDAAVLLTIAL
jgi:hypothetical protein